MDPDTRNAAIDFAKRALLMFAAYLVLMGLCAALHGCSSAREKALSSSLAGVNVARDTFVVFDREHQATIVDQAPSIEEGQDALKAYRERRQVVMHAFAMAYAAIAAAAVDVNADSLVDAVRALKVLRDEIGALRTGESR